ncbi:hypothetical protein O3G_MSEX005459 [Manduca sexta]|nr:hypothetical protein O3G_MSEX005459 [Manduca sexta]
MNFRENLLIVLVYCCVLWAAQSAPTEKKGRIVGGTTAKPHSHPYLVSLQYRLLWIRAHFCGGALLNENWVLSAGHCVDQPWYIRWIPVDLIAGIDDVDNFGPTAQIGTIAQKIPHPLYGGDIGPYDIAMIQMKAPFRLTKEVQPINLPINNNLRSQYQHLTVAGWGSLKTTAFIPDLPSRLQEVEVTYIPFDECYDAIDEVSSEGDEENPLDRVAHLCTGPLSGGIAACSGDSGGPLIQYISPSFEDTNATENPIANEINVEENDFKTDEPNKILNTNVIDNRIPIVIGVVSWGISPCGVKGAPTIYTNVSSYMNFINKYLYD